MTTALGRPSASIFDHTQLHVAYVTTDGSILDDYYDRQAGWMRQDITARIKGTPAAARELTTIVTKDQWHAIYRTADNGLSHLYYRENEGWFHDDLTGLAKARATIGAASLVVTPGQLHAFYRDDRNHVSHVYFRKGEWVWEDMQTVVPGNLPDAAEDPAAIHAYEQLHVAYRAGDGQLGHFYHDNKKGWVRQDMMTPENRAPRAKGVPVFLAYHNRLECFYRDSADHIARLYFAKGGWRYEDLTVASGCPVAAAGDPAAIDHKGPHIVFRDAGGHLADVSMPQDDTWVYRDLTRESSAPKAVSDPGVVAHEGHWHAVFVAEDGHVHDVYFDGTWHTQDLDALAKNPAPIGKVALRNEGAYFVAVRFDYLRSDGRQRISSATTGTPFPVGETNISDPGDHGVPEGAELWIEIQATLGESAQGHQHFIYQKGVAQMARYHCSGTTLDVDLSFDGVRPGSAEAAVDATDSELQA